MGCVVACAGVERANLRYIWLINSLEQCFSNWVPQEGVSGSERRKFVMAEQFYWRSQYVCTN